jgi:hypothetical protein
MVSPCGFCGTAKRKAESLGVTCIDLAEVDRFPWISITFLSIFRQRVRHIELSVILDSEHLAVATDGFTLVGPDGAAVTREMLRATLAQRLLSEPVPLHHPPEYTLSFSYPVAGLLVSMAKTGGSYPARALAGTAHFTVTEQNVPLRLVKYGQSGTSDQEAEAAIATVNVGPLQGDFVLSRRGDENGQLVFVPR